MLEIRRELSMYTQMARCYDINDGLRNSLERTSASPSKQGKILLSGRAALRSM